MNHDWMPHGHCVLWDPGLIAVRILSDLAIAGSYFAIPIVLYKLRVRELLPTLPFVNLMFVIFITACGLTHVFDVITIWWPVYWIDAWMRAFTGLVSATTATALWRIWPMLRRLQ